MKVIYNGEEIELEDKLEKGVREQDMFTTDIDLEDTIEFDLPLEDENG